MVDMQKINAVGDVKFSIKEIISNNNFLSGLVGLYVFCWFTQIGKRVGLLGDIRFEFILGLALTVLSFFYLFNKPKTIKNSAAGKIAFLMILYFGIFSFASYNPELSWNVYFNRVIKFSLLSLFIYVFIDNVHKLAFILFCYLIAALKVGEEGLLGWLSGNMIWENQGIPRLHGSIDMYAHPNSFSGFAVSLLPFIYCFYPIVNRYFKGALIFLFVCALVIVVFTGSRTGYVATCLLLIYVLIKNFKYSFGKFILMAIPLIIAATFFLPQEYKERFNTIFSQEDQQGGSTVARKQIIYDSLEVFIQHPFGVGLGAFPEVRENIFGRSQDTHNLYLEILTNTGFIGLIIFFLFISQLLKTNQKIIRFHMSHDSSESPFLIALASSMVGFIWARLFLGLFGMDMYEIYWWLALGLTLSNFYISYKHSARPVGSIN